MTRTMRLTPAAVLAVMLAGSLLCLPRISMAARNSGVIAVGSRTAPRPMKPRNGLINHSLRCKGQRGERHCHPDRQRQPL